MALEAEAVTSIIIAITAIIAIIIAVYNLYLIRIHSSPKPFLEPFCAKLNIKEIAHINPAVYKDAFSPNVKLRNIGQGIAVKIKVSVLIETKDGRTKNVTLKGLEIITANKEAEYIAKKSNDFVLDSKIHKVIISYQSDSGFPRKAIWNVLGKKSFSLESSS